MTSARKSQLRIYSISCCQQHHLKGLLGQIMIGNEQRMKNIPWRSGHGEKCRKRWRRRLLRVALFNSYSWTLGDSLWYIFALQDKNGRKFEPSLRHYQIVAKFLTGETNILVSKILELWIKSPYGTSREQWGADNAIFNQDWVSVN